MLVRLKANNQLHWYFKNCNSKCTEVIKLVAEMNERQKILTKKVDMCTQKLERMTTYQYEQFKQKTKQVIQQEIKDTVSHNDEQFKEQTRRLIREESYELKQREDRECNIIISNVSEEEEASDEEDRLWHATLQTGRSGKHIQQVWVCLQKSTHRPLSRNRHCNPGRGWRLHGGII